MMKRYATAITSGTLVTLGLFWVMTTLISLHHGKPVPARERGALDFYMMTREEPVVPQAEKQFRELTQPVDLPPARPQHSAGDAITGVRVLQARAPAPNRSMPVFTAHQDGPLVALLRVEPDYPERAKTMDLDGYVIVQFDVLPDGTVTNALIVESSHPVFEQAAIKAASRFRYKARVVNGEPLGTQGLQNLFRFEIERR